MLARLPAVSIAIPLALLASPALAQVGNSASVPEPANTALFAIGVIGLVIGHHVAKKRD